MEITILQPNKTISRRKNRRKNHKFLAALCFMLIFPEWGWALSCISCPGQTHIDRNFTSKIHFLRSFEWSCIYTVKRRSQIHGPFAVQMLTGSSTASICVALSSAELNRMCQTLILDNLYDPAHLWPYAIPPAYTWPFIIDYLQLHVENCLMGPHLHKQGQFLLSI